ncbi:MAG: UvrB/UvrC motif-containing protein [Synergistaceae bacterium]|jgi:protein arginine kinase activator|nr:UvrB/UvrC motif-containing protein [Synergistaceae bacterium]
MLCDNCGKNEAEVLIRQVIDEEVRNLSLCRSCAEKMGFISSLVPSVTISFSIGESAPKQKKIRKVQTRKRELPFEPARCPACGLDFASFRAAGVLGCPGCYEAFRVPLGIYLRKTQGAESHWVASDAFSEIGVVSGDVNRRTDIAAEEKTRGNIARLRMELNEAVSSEDYERAARLRDLLAPLVGGADKKND